jgi:Ulp1 family protease
VRRVTKSSNGLLTLTFELRELSILASPNAWLNDGCINGCSRLLQCAFPSAYADTCAILSTHELPRIRYNTSDEALWKQTYRTEFWLKDIWIIPIHRPAPINHWVVCICYHSKRELHLFDSFSERKHWRSDLKVGIETSTLASYLHY